MDSIIRQSTLQLKKTANFIAFEGGNKECYWYALILTLYVLIGDLSMKMALANLLLRYTPCFVSIRSNGISLEWIWQGSFLRWDLLAPVGMQIILVERNTLEMVPYHRSRQPHYTVKSRVLQLFSKK